jgi:hypothetical protein
MNEKRAARPQPLGDVLASMFAQGTLGAAGVLLRLRRGWPEACGATLAEHTRPVAVRDGALVVEVDHPIYSQELKLIERRVLEALRVVAHVDARCLSFAVARHASPEVLEAHGAAGMAERVAPAPPELPETDAARLRAAAENVTDDELRAAITGVAERLGARHRGGSG